MTRRAKRLVCMGAGDGVVGGGVLAQMAKSTPTRLAKMRNSHSEMEISLISCFVIFDGFWVG